MIFALQTRPLYDLEVSYIQRLTNRWRNEYLKSLQAREFTVDNAHTIRNASFMRDRFRVSSSEMTHDLDGALVDVILYETSTGEFGELELNRLDTKPLLLKAQIIAS